MSKKKRTSLYAILLLGLLGIGSASAFIINDATGISTSQTLDKAIVLEWGTENITDAIVGLEPTTPQYRTVSVAAPRKSATVTETPTFSAKLVNGAGVAEKTVSLRGIKVEFAETTWLAETPPSAIGTLTLDWSGSDWTPNAGGTDNTGNPGEKTATITAAKTYYVKISINQEAFAYYADASHNFELSGKLVFAYKAVAA